MAKAWNQLKNPLLNLNSTIAKGKLANCRVCDVAETDWEYLLWAHKQGYLPLDKAALQVVTAYQQQALQDQHYREEVAPYVEFDDVPW